MINFPLPHMVCLLGNVPLITAHVVGDGLIAIAYFAIPMVLWQLKRLLSVEMPGNLLFWFGLFILSCGLTHVYDILVIWYPLYFSQALIKGMTAISSLTTLRLLLKVLKVPVMGVQARS